jgi:hypothetical protein
MAKVHEEMLVIKFSKLIKDNGNVEQTIVTDEICDALQQVAETLAGAGIVVELNQN